MILTIYIFILAYFLLGGIGFYFINRRKEKEVARESWTKFITYFILIHILFFSIVVNPLVFRWLVALVVAVGTVELIKLFVESSYKNKGFVFGALVVFAVFSVGLWHFSTLDKNLVLYTFLLLSIFDAFSQISGQLWGKAKIVPKISPNKTIGGTVGGAVFTLCSAYILRSLYPVSWGGIVLLASGILLFAFIGDISASIYKRKFGVKDFSKLIPGHGGFLDRFDSLLVAGAWVALWELVLFEFF